MASNNLLELSKDEEFKQLIEQNKNTPIFLDFWAPWAQPCAQMNDVFAELAKKNTAYKFIKIEAEKFPEISESYEITAVPTFIVIKNGKIVDCIVGVNAPELTNLINKNIKAASLGTPSQPRCGFSKQIIGILNEHQVKYGIKEYSNWPTYPQLYINGELVGGLDIVKELVESGEFKSMVPKEKSLDEKLQELINKADIMVFIKGSQNNPKCGFSKQLIGILDEKKVKYEDFDILQDEEVRQGLKTFVNWPTYPMVFHKGNLIGGLDIIKELKESGELDEILSN
nr:15368_t:CDS:2 [Entrophospora candida]